MREGKLQIYCGSGKGKTTAALGQAIKEASLGRSVFIVQFMKCRKADEEISFIQRLEPEIKLFRFQRREAAFEDLAPEEQQEEIMNMKNGLNFAKKDGWRRGLYQQRKCMSFWGRLLTVRS